MIQNDQVDCPMSKLPLELDVEGILSGTVLGTPFYRHSDYSAEIA